MKFGGVVGANGLPNRAKYDQNLSSRRAPTPGFMKNFDPIFFVNG